MFYFEQLKITGPGVRTAILDFKKGLNIIHGPSDTGKSYIIECITYLMGSKFVRIDKATGYDTIELTIINHDDSKVFISRKIGENEIAVKSIDSDIEGGNYNTKSIDRVWLKLMGINDVPQIIKDDYLKKQGLTVHKLEPLFVVKEDYIFKEGSILLSEQKAEQIAGKSALLFMYNGKDNRDEVELEKPESKAAKKKAVDKYRTNTLNFIRDKKASIEINETSSSIDIEKKVDSILLEIDDAQNVLTNLVNRSRKNITELYRVNENISEKEMLLSRYNKLQQHYEADIKRLSFIAEGYINRLDLAEVDSCPFCGGDLEVDEQIVYIDSLKFEAEDLINKNNGLLKTINAIEDELRILYEEEKKLKVEREDIEQKIGKDIYPRIASLREPLITIDKTKEAEALDALAVYINEDIPEKIEREEDDKKYDVIDRFGNTFFKGIEEELSDLFRECSFGQITKIKFDKNNFDLEVDGKPKEKYGKGYRAFMNTILIVAIQKYLRNFGSYTPNILILDSPILSLSEKEDVSESDNKKVALFSYLMKQEFNAQTIVLENDIPNMNYDNANMIEFTGDKSRGRYGLLNINN